MRLPIYLDYMATTPVDDRVIEKMNACMGYAGNFGNPASSTHSYGWHAREQVDLARQQVANLINADPKEIIWTSGATESINLALTGTVYFYQRQGKHLITSVTEHPAVLDTCRFLEQQGFSVTYLIPQRNGLLHPEQIQNALQRDTILVSIMHVNNEIGVIQDIQAIAALVHAKGALLHVDAAQSAGKIAIDVKNLGADLLSLSAHKIYGPKGIGALYVRGKPRIHLQPLLHGGGHERGLRSGTLATHQIVGMGTAFALAKELMTEENQRILALRNRLWSGIKSLDNVFVNGDMQQRVAGNLNVSFANVNGEELLLALQDLAVSSGSACTSALAQPSHILQAIGVPDALARSTIRFSLGRYTTEEEIDYAIQLINKVVPRLRGML